MENQKRPLDDVDKKTSPLVKRLKVIPPKGTEATKTFTLTVGVDEVDGKDLNENKEEELVKEKIAIKEDDKSSVLDETKKNMKLLKLRKDLEKMDMDYSKVLKLITEAREKKIDSIILNDSRLTNFSQSNYLGSFF